ncbi:short-chain type dehydrogenase [Apiospora marii]|uniref:short-chain type dehydrogenase n=1 Tax=Apiospora marii TaxID=335849 RepID=UPI00312F834B
MTQALLALIDQSSGNSSCGIVTNIASVGALITDPGLRAFQMSKMALACLLEFIGVKHGDKSIVAISINRVNVTTTIADS